MSPSEHKQIGSHGLPPSAVRYENGKWFTKKDLGALVSA